MKEVGNLHSHKSVSLHCIATTIKIGACFDPQTKQNVFVKFCLRSILVENFMWCISKDNLFWSTHDRGPNQKREILRNSIHTYSSFDLPRMNNLARVLAASAHNREDQLWTIPKRNVKMSRLKRVKGRVKKMRKEREKKMRESLTKRKVPMMRRMALMGTSLIPANLKTYQSISMYDYILINYTNL